MTDNRRSKGAHPGGRHIVIDLTAGRRPVVAPEGAEVVGGDWLARFYLGQHLEGDGLDVQWSETTLGLGFGGASCKVRVDESYDGSSASVPLWFDVTLPDAGVTIQESLAALTNETTPEAVAQSVQDAVHMFARGSLAPIRHLYRPGTAEDGITHGKLFVLNGEEYTEWELIEGPALMLAAESAIAADVKRAIGERGLFVGVSGEVASLLREPGLHWCKMFLWRNTQGLVDGHVTFDNHDVPQVLEALKSFQLPGTGRAVVRQFAVLRPLSIETTF